MKNRLVSLAVAVSLALLCAGAQAMDKAALVEADAVRAVTGGFCGYMPLGNGLVAGKGWLHQPVSGLATKVEPNPPVMVQVRTKSPGGTIRTLEMKGNGLPPQHLISLSMKAGRPYYVEVTWAMPGDDLEWKIDGYEWGVVPKGFQLPPSEDK